VTPGNLVDANVSEEHSAFIFRVVFKSEDGDIRFHRNVCNYQTLAHPSNFTFFSWILSVVLGESSDRIPKESMALFLFQRSSLENAVRKQIEIEFKLMPIETAETCKTA
jgi:hypothetical protein